MPPEERACASAITPEDKIGELVKTLIDKVVAVYVQREREACAKIADEKAADCTKRRVVLGGLERNYYGGGLEASKAIAGAIRAKV